MQESLVNSQPRNKDVINERNRAFQRRNTTRTFSVRATINNKVTYINTFSIISVIAFSCRFKLRNYSCLCHR